MTRNWVSMTITLLVLAGFSACARTGRLETASGDVAASMTLPAGAAMSARLNQSLSTRSVQIGDSFTATITAPILVQNGRALIPRGATLFGHVSGVHAVNGENDRAMIRLAFDSLMVLGRRYPFEGTISTASAALAGNAATRAGVLSIVGSDELDKGATAGTSMAARGTVISLGSGTDPVLTEGAIFTVRSSHAVTLR